MKKTLLKATILIVTIQFLFTQCKNTDDGNNDQPLKKLTAISTDTLNMSHDKGLLAEDPLKISVVEKPALDAEQHIENTPSYLKINNTPLSLLGAEINTVAITALQNTANTLSCAAGTRSVTGVRIYYGVASNSLILYYQPLLFGFIREGTGGGLESHSNYSVCAEGQVYTYAAGANTFATADAAAMAQSVRNYTTAVTGIRIRRSATSGDFDNFRAGTTMLGDANSVVFSFQQINKICNTPGNAGKIRLWNTVGVYPAQNQIDLIRHVLLISSDDVTNNANDLLVTANPFSNLSHICPPSCNDNSFWFITIPNPGE